MSAVFWGALVLGIAAPSVASAGHALAWKRDPRSALGWEQLVEEIRGIVERA